MRGAAIIACITVIACRDAAQPAPPRRAAERRRDAGTTIDVAAVNVPAAVRDRLEFEQRVAKLTQHGKPVTYTFAAPKGWDATQSDDWDTAIIDVYQGSDRMVVGYWDCSTDCSTMATFLANKPGREDWRVVKEAKTKGRYSIVAVTPSSIVVGNKSHASRQPSRVTTQMIWAWWTDGASSIDYCSVDLDGEREDAVPAFERACLHVVVARGVP